MAWAACTILSENFSICKMVRMSTEMISKLKLTRWIMTRQLFGYAKPVCEIARLIIKTATMNIDASVILLMRTTKKISSSLGYDRTEATAETKTATMSNTVIYTLIRLIESRYSITTLSTCLKVSSMLAFSSELSVLDRPSYKLVT